MRAMLRTLAALGLIAASACAAVATSEPAPVLPPDHPVRMETLRVPLGIGGATLSPGVRYAGGLSLKGSELHGLSDLKIVGDTAWVVSDYGDLMRFRLRFDRSGRLVAADSARARPLTGPDGDTLTPKSAADAEGLAILPDGRVLVAFEGDHRIWSYGAGAGDRPARVSTPALDRPGNEGLEALSAAPNGWLAMAEGGGAWLCDDRSCVAFGDPRPADGYRFTGADRDPAGGWFVVERFYEAPFDMRARVRRLSSAGALSKPIIQLRIPASVDNFEGIAAVPTPTGVRLYLLSDDNGNGVQATLLLAFDVPSA